MFPGNNMFPPAFGQGSGPGFADRGMIGPGQGLPDGPQQGGKDEYVSFFKTRICHKWQQGLCPFGDECKYAHGEHDLRAGGAGGAAIAGGAGPRDGPQRRQPDDRLRQMGDNQLGPSHSQRTGGAFQNGGLKPQQGEKQVNRDYKKTRLCEKFDITGNCPYGDKCTFAHGRHELRSGGPENTAGLRDSVGQIMRASPAVPTRQENNKPPVDLFKAGSGRMNIMRPMHVGVAPQAIEAQRLDAPGQQRGQALPGPPPGPGLHAAAAVTAAHMQPQLQPVPQQMQQAAPSKPPEVSFVDRVRATCALLNIPGNATLDLRDKPAAMQAAVTAIMNGSAFRENPFADSVEEYLPVHF